MVLEREYTAASWTPTAISQAPGERRRTDIGALDQGAPGRDGVRLAALVPRAGRRAGRAGSRGDLRAYWHASRVPGRRPRPAAGPRQPVLRRRSGAAEVLATAAPFALPSLAASATVNVGRGGFVPGRGSGTLAPSARWALAPLASAVLWQALLLSGAFLPSEYLVGDQGRTGRDGPSDRAPSRRPGLPTLNVLPGRPNGPSAVCRPIMDGATGIHTGYATNQVTGS